MVVNDTFTKVTGVWGTWYLSVYLWACSVLSLFARQVDVFQRVTAAVCTLRGGRLIIWIILKGQMGLTQHQRKDLYKNSCEQKKQSWKMLTIISNLIIIKYTQSYKAKWIYFDTIQHNNLQYSTYWLMTQYTNHFSNCHLRLPTLAKKKETYSTAAVDNASLLWAVQSHLLISFGSSNVLLVPEKQFP